jgi:beta-1,4-mannosyl-glycoprotein beta-1,4-N-acetylglucosaminyltransferase
MFFDPRADYEAVFSASEARLADLVRRRRELLREDPERSRKAWEIACANRNLTSLIALGRAMREEGALEPQAQIDFGAALIASRRFQEAVQALEPPLGDNASLWPYWALFAQALAGAGRHDEAFDALETCRRLGAPPKASARLEPPLALVRQWAGRQTRRLAWKHFASLIEGLAAIGDLASAVPRLRKGLGSLPAPELLDTPAALRVINLGLTLLEPAELEPLLGRLNAIAPADPGVRAAVLDVASRRGNWDETLALVAAVEPDAPRRVRAAAARAVYASGDLEEGIRRLGALASEDENDLENMAALTRCVGDQVRKQVGLEFTRPGPRKVFNLVTFNNEFTVTEMRMHEMAPWVDHFVFVEAGETFIGRPKPMRFEECRPLLAGYEEKIVHIKIDRFPPFVADAWAREFYQRDMGLAGLKGLVGPDDVVMVTDADEIVDRRALSYFDGPLASMRMTLFKFFLNYCADKRNKMRHNRAGAICRAQVLAQFGPSYLRSGLSRYQKDFHLLPNAGWHFSSITDAATISDKFRSYSHQGRSKAVWRRTDYVAGVLEEVRRGEFEVGWTRARLDDGLPSFVRKNRKRLSEYLL